MTQGWNDAAKLHQWLHCFRIISPYSWQPKKHSHTCNRFRFCSGVEKLSTCLTYTCLNTNLCQIIEKVLPKLIPASFAISMNVKRLSSTRSCWTWPMLSSVMLVRDRQSRFWLRRIIHCITETGIPCSNIVTSHSEINEQCCVTAFSTPDIHSDTILEKGTFKFQYWARRTKSVVDIWFTFV